MKRFAFVALVWVFATGPLFGQAETTGRISGRVVNDHGDPVLDARITLVSPALQGTRTTTTGADGRFLAALLPVGDYAVGIEADGMRTTRVSLRVTVGSSEPLLVTLREGATVQENVTVYGTVTPLETTVVGENFNYRKEIEALPIIDRDVETVAKLAPNVSNFFSESDPGSRYIAISGGTRYETLLTLDGAELTDPLGFLSRQLYLEDSIEEVQVLTAGVSARYGRFAGGVLNAITKSGGNAFDGTVRVEFSKEAWNGRSPFGEMQSDKLDRVYQGTLGGYIVKDKLWFFAGARTIPSESRAGRTFTTNEDYVETQSEDRWQLKFRGAPSRNHTIEASYLDYELAIRGGEGGQAFIPGDLRAASSSGSFPGDLKTLTYQGVLGRASFLEVVASERNVRSARGGPLELGSPIWDGSFDDIFYNNVWSDPADPIDRDNESVAIHATHVLGTEKLGTHTLQSGIQYLDSITGGANRWAATGYIWGHFFNGAAFPFVEPGPGPGEVRFNVNATDQDNVRWEDIPLAGDQEIHNTAIYIQDSWQLRNWRFDVGLRWERYSGEAPSGFALGIDADELAPRLGVTYNVRPNLQVQGFWGKYAARLDEEFLTRSTGLGFAPSIGRLYVGPEVLGATAADLEALLADDSNWDDLVDLLDPANPTATISADLELPYARDWNLSVRYGLPRGTGAITVSYLDRDFRALLEPQVGEFGSTIVQAPDGPESLTVDRIVLDNEPDARRNYRALAATWDYRPGLRWSIGGNYTYSKTDGNQEEDFGLVGSALGTYERSRPDYAATPSGRLSWDKPHLLRAWGNYLIDLGRKGGVSLGGIVQYQSGTPWSRRARVAYADDPGYLNETSNRYWFHFDGRGNNRFDDWWSLDVSARYQIDIREGLSTWVKATISNLFDNDAMIAFNTGATASATPPAGCSECVTDVASGLTWVPSSSFGEARSTSDFQLPRRYLLTLGFSF